MDPINVLPSDFVVFGSIRSPKSITITSGNSVRSFNVRIRFEGDDGLVTALTSDSPFFDFTANSDPVKKVTILISSDVFVRENVHDSLIYIEYRESAEENWSLIDTGTIRVYCGDFPTPPPEPANDLNQPPEADPVNVFLQAVEWLQPLPRTIVQTLWL